MADNLVKLMDETGYRQLINMLISIKSSQQEDVEKCISVWQPETMYQKDKVVLVVNDNTYSEYVCKATHVSGETFDETYWTLVSCTQFEGYTEEELLDMLNLSEIELQNLQSILQPDVVSTTSTWDSSKIYAELLTVLSESKNFTIAEVAKIVSFSYKVVASEDDVVDDKAIYLIENSTTGTYDMYLFVDGSPSKVGHTNINLEGYVKKEDIIDTFDETATYTDSDKVFSTKVSKSMYDGLNDKKISKSNIVTTIDDTVTDEQIPSAKAINDKLNYLVLEKTTLEGKNGFTYTIILEDDMNVKGYPANHDIYTLEITEDNTQIQLEIYHSDTPMTYDINGNVGVNITASVPITLNKGTYKLKLMDGFIALGSDKITDVVIGEKITSYRLLFYNCTSLTTLDLSNLDTSHITDMLAMFYNCASLTTLDLSHFDTSNVTDMFAMFNGCASLTALDLSSFDTSKVTNMYAMFNNCAGLTSLDLSNFNTSKVTDMYAMFSGCTGLTSLALSNFNTSNIDDMGYMFTNCRALTTLDLSSFDTSNVTKMYFMFSSCASLTTLDLSNFDTSNVTYMNSMFFNCSGMTTLKLGSKFITTKVTQYGSMFKGCSALTKIQIPADFPADSRTFLEARLTEAGILANVTFETY